MNVSDLPKTARFVAPVAPVAPVALMLLASTLGISQATQPTISLEKQNLAEVRTVDLPQSEQTLAAKAPANSHFFGAAKVGEAADLQALTLKFAARVKLTGIESTPDFAVEQGSSCVEGNFYEQNATCRLLVRFTPRGPGHRMGRMNISYEGGVKPLSLGLNGYGYGPVASFTPALITTVPGSYPSSKGLLSGASNLAVDDGDSLYIADTGNNVIRYLTSGGTFQNYPTLFLVTAPIGVAVDDLGTVYFTQNSPSVFQEVDFNTSSYYESGSDTCAVGATCALYQQSFSNLGALAFDHNESIFAGASYSVARLSPGLLNGGFIPPLNYTPLADQYISSAAPAPGALTVDSGDTIYTYADISVENSCVIVAESYYDAVNQTGIYRKIAGGQAACGFSGDGGQARTAEIGTSVGQMAFDIAGNLYFTDTANQRVRRIDGQTGIINTIAGTGTAGYSGDGGPATLAPLSSPTGVGVDSQGQVYVVSSAAATGTAQVVRKLGPNGALSFSSQLKGKASAAKLVTVSNTGNDAMVFTRVFVSGTNASDFTIDPNTTSCILTVGSQLAAGQSCKIGVIFTPGAAGSRAATIAFLDNTVTNSNVVQLSGVGTLPAATFAITAPATGTSVAAGTTVKFSVSVTSTTTPAPTGTVKFSVNGVAFGSPVTLSSGVASVNVTGLTAGTTTLTATYSGDANFAAATLSRPITVTAAAKAPATVKVAAKTNPATTCTSVVFSAAVTGKTTAKPTGVVELKEGSTVLVKAELSNGAATLTVPVLKAGTYTLTASYLGDSEYAASSSSALKETVSEGGVCSTPRSGPVKSRREAAAE